MVYLYGLSPAASLYRQNPDDLTRGNKNALRVSRAAHKITEIIDGMGVLEQLQTSLQLQEETTTAAATSADSSGAVSEETQAAGEEVDGAIRTAAAAGAGGGGTMSALDIGASPGGWTKVLACHPSISAVVAVDPAGVTPAVAALAGVTVHTAKCEDVYAELIAAGPYGVIACDANVDSVRKRTRRREKRHFLTNKFCVVVPSLSWESVALKPSARSPPAALCVCVCAFSRMPRTMRWVLSRLYCPCYRQAAC